MAPDGMDFNDLWRRRSPAEIAAGRGDCEARTRAILAALGDGVSLSDQARREGLTQALVAPWALEGLPGRARVTLALAGGALLLFLRDTSSDAPAVVSPELAPIRRHAVDGARGFLYPFAMGGDSASRRRTFGVVMAAERRS